MMGHAVDSATRGRMGSSGQMMWGGRAAVGRGAAALLLVAAVILCAITPRLLAGTDECLVPAGGYSTGAQPRAVAVGDFNGDGRLDLVTANAGANSVSILLGNTATPSMFTAATNYAVGGGTTAV